MTDQSSTKGRAVQFTDEAKHQATLTLLSEVADYLDRLPAVPTTRDLARKVRAHLEAPTQALVQLVEHERATRWRGETG